MQDVARRLAPIEISDAAGSPVVLGTAWSERPVLLVFIRHFG
jgi:hypothetical protein